MNATIHPPRRSAGDFLRSSRRAGVSAPVKIEQTRDALELTAKRAVAGREVIRQPFLRSTIRDAAVNDDGTPKPLEGTINTGEVDRYQSIIVPAGMDFTAFRANPVMLWQHGLDFAGSWPIGRVLEINRTADTIDVKWEFDLEGDLASELDRLYRQKWLRGLSIGFIPTAYDFIMVDGRSVIRYTACELAELSCVAVPGNPKCLSRTMGADRQRRLADLLEQRAGAMFSKANREVIEAHAADLETHANDMRDMARDLRDLVAERSEDAADLSGGGGDISIGSKGSADKSPDLSGDGGDTAIKGGRSTQVWVCDPEDVFPVEWGAPFDTRTECVAARGNVKVLRAMSTASTRKGGQERHVLIHHHADGRVSWRALAACMATLLTTPVDLTDDQKLAAYEHLAEHYRAIGVVPPAAGRKAPAEAYDLAIEGRMAHIDTAGNAWVYARALNPASAVAMPVFTRVDSNRSRTFHVPRFGLSNPSSWGRAIPNGRPAEPGSLSEVARLMI